ncbi:MAG: O-antigen ligase family protein [Prevotella sp.]|jgi:hypothetical protein|nr:O-antigen ligase family protein [Prevotella sp.]
MAYIILVPCFELRVLGISFGLNLINLVLLCSFLFQFWRKKIKLDFRTSKPFLFLFISLFCISFFADMQSPDIQLNQWRVDIMATCILPFIVWNASINDKRFLTWIVWTLMISVLVSGCYAISIIDLDGLNYYTSYIVNYFGKEYDFAERFGNSERIRNQGTFSHPFSWVFYLSLMSILISVFFYTEKKRNIKVFYLLLLVFIVFNVFIADVRAALASIIITFQYIYIRYNKLNFKTIFVFIIFVSLVAFFITLNDDLTERFLSMIDIGGRKTNITGSSFQMRLDQFNGCLKEVAHTPLFGKGYGWTTYYISKNFTHPVILAFESLIFVVICDHGIAGIFIWIIFAFMLFLIPRNILKTRKKYLVDGLIVFFFAFSLITGLYSYLVNFSLFYVILLAYLYHIEKKEINTVKKIVKYEK